MRSKVELYERIQRDHLQHGWGIRQLARQHHCHRRDVRQALARALPPPRRGRVFEAPVLGPWKPVIDAILEGDQRVARKQRHTRAPHMEAADL